MLVLGSTIEYNKTEIPELPTSASQFKFRGNSVLKYLGNEEEIIIPESYSVETRTENIDGFWINDSQLSTFSGTYIRNFSSVTFKYESTEITYTNATTFRNNFATDFPNGCYLVSQVCTNKTHFNWLVRLDQEQVFNQVCINGKSFVSSCDAYTYINENNILSVNFGGQVDLQYFIDGGDIEVDSVGLSSFDNTIIGMAQVPSLIQGTPVKEVKLKNNINTIYVRGLASSTLLEEVYIPYTLSDVYVQAFNEDTNLTKVHIDNIESWCNINFADTFYSNPLSSGTADLYLNDVALTNITIPNTIRTIKNYAFYRYANMQSITFEENSQLESIGENTFEGCGISNVTLPDSLLSIGNNCFLNCLSLTSFNVPASVTTIGYGIVAGCPIETITVDENNSVYDSRNNCNAIIETATNTLVSGCINTIIPADIEVIGRQAFYYCNLTSINLPNTLTTIGIQAFQYCRSLTSISIPANVTEIGANAFLNCSGLTGNVTIPSGVTVLPNQIFSGCTSITSVTLPEGLLSIGQNCFNNCIGLTELTIPSTVTSINTNALARCSGLVSLTVPFIGNRAGVTATDTYQYPLGYFFGGTAATGMTTIQQQYYGANTSSLTSANYKIPSGLRTVVITNSGYINTGAFYNCSMITRVILTGSEYTIRNDSFRYCGLTSLAISPDVTLMIVQTNAFRNCNAFNRIDITDLDAYCNIAFGGNIGVLQNRYLYLNGEQVTNLIIPNTIEAIFGGNFTQAYGISTIYIPNSVQVIFNRAFRNMSNPSPTSITIDNITPPLLMDSNAFDNASPCPIYVPASAVEDYQTATNWIDLAARIQAIPE